jgi:hypothetical protein
MELFQSERAVYTKLKSRLMETHEGAYALIFGAKLVGVYPSSKDAYRAGLSAAGLDRPFYMKKISRDSAPAYVHGVRDARHT